VECSATTVINKVQYLNDNRDGKFAWRNPLDLRRKTNELMEVIDELAHSCVDIDRLHYEIIDDVPMPAYRAHHDACAEGSFPTEDLTPFWLDATSIIDDFLLSLDQGSKDSCEWSYVDVLEVEHDGIVQREHVAEERT
jgi:hypothetical protein